MSEKEIEMTENKQRAEDEAHVKTVNQKIADCLLAHCYINATQANVFVASVMLDLIPNVTINY